MIPKEAGSTVSYPKTTTYTSIKTGETKTVSNYPTQTYLPSKPVPIDTYSGPSMQTATPEEQQHLDTQVAAILGTPEGMELVGTKEQMSAMPAANMGLVPVTETVAVYAPQGAFDTTWADVPVVSFFFPSMTRATTPEEKTAFKQQTMNKTIQYQSLTERTSMSLATVLIGTQAISTPTMAISSIAGVGIGTGLKYGLTGKPLSNQEIIFSAGVGQMGGLLGSDLYHSGIVQKGYSKLAGKLNPEKAMYNRVFESQPKTSLVDRALGKLSPEKALYNRVTRLPGGSKISDSGLLPFKSDSYGGGSGGGYSTVSSGGGFAQQVLYRQAPAIKAPMKNILPTLTIPKQALVASALTGVQTKTIPKTTTKQIPTLVSLPKQQAQAAKTQQVSKQQTELTTSVALTGKLANPFTAFSGRSYYKQKQQQEQAEEETVLSYPKSGLKQPTFTSIIPATTFKPATEIATALKPDLSMFPAFPKTGLSVDVRPSVNVKQGFNLVPKTGNVPSQVSTLTGKTGQLRVQAQKLSVLQQPVSRGGFRYPRGSEFVKPFSNRSLFGKWSPRTHPVKSFDKMLKTFGMGKVPKSVVKLGRMETPRDFPKLFTQKRRRRKR